MIALPLSARYGTLTAISRVASISAHTGPPPTPDRIWSSWSLDPAVLLPLVLVVAVYVRGLRSLWLRAGTGNGVAAWRAGCFGLGALTLLVALVTPLDGLAAALFSAHMVQHLLLIAIAAPLLMLGEPGAIVLWALPLRGRRGTGRWWRRHGSLRSTWHALTRLPVAWAIAVVTLWLWHVPALYDATLRNALVHGVEHACFLATACLFWWTVFDGVDGRKPAYGPAILFIFATALANTVLGALLTFSRQQWYTPYAGSTIAWGLSPTEDQQIAGLIMWIPAGALYLLAASALFVAWMGGAEEFTDVERM